MPCSSKKYRFCKKRFPAGIIPAAFLLCCFILYPLGRLFFNALHSGSVFHDTGTWHALLNTLFVSTLTTVLTVSISCFLAWLTVSTDLPGKSFIKKIAWLTFSVPAYILGISWIELLGRNGYLQRLLLHGAGTATWSFPYYSLGAVVVVFTIHLYPLVFAILVPLFRSLDPAQEQAAALCGMSPRDRFFRITLPLVFPGIAAAGLLVFSRSAANFSVPALLALPVRKEVLTTRIYSSLSTLNLGDASVLSFILIGLSGLLFLCQKKITGKKRFSTGKPAGVRNPVLLGKFRMPLFILVIVFQILTGIVPVAVLIFSSLLKRWGLPLERRYFTLQNYGALLFGNSAAIKALKNSLCYGLAASLFAGILAMCVSFLSVFYPSKITKLLENIAGWPLAVPNIVLAVAAVLAWNNPVLPLYGSPWGIIVTYMVLFIPLMLKNISGLMESFPGTLLSAARLSGASFRTAFFDILFPLLRSGFESGLMICMLIALREIPISLMLYSTGQETLGVLLFGMQSQSYGLEMTSALAVFVIVLTMGGQCIRDTLVKS